jgi:hypothetical protein
MKNTADLPVSIESRAVIPGPSEIWRSTKRWFVPYVVVAFAAIFYLPRFVSSAPSASDSYLFGYNNRIAIILLLFFVALGVVLTRGFGLQIKAASEHRPLRGWMLWVALLLLLLACAAIYFFAGPYLGFGESHHLLDRAEILFLHNKRISVILLLFFAISGTILTHGFSLQSTHASEHCPLPGWMLWVSLLLVLFACGAMFLIAGRYHGFGESYYLIDRIALLDQGRMPYLDFEFVYGPAQLYGPQFLHHTLPLGIGDSYYLFWSLSYLIGAYLLFKCIDDIRFPSPAKPAIYVMLYGAGLFATIRMGTNYTFLRYALPLYLVVKLNARFRDSRLPRILMDVLLCSIFCVLLVLSSPETAVAFGFASGCIVLFCRTIPLAKRALIAALLIVAYGAIFAVALKLHVLDAMLADGGGAISFPIVPGPPMLVYFIAIFISACWLYRSFLNRATDDPTLGLLFFSIPMIAAALGRCDPSHVFWNGLATFLASLLYMSLFKRAWPVYALAYLLFVFLLPNASEFYLFVPQLRAARYLDKHPEARPSDTKIQAFLASFPGNYVAPFGFRPDGFGTYQSPRIEYGRFEDVINVSMPHSIQQKLSEMRNHPDRALILPPKPEEYCRPVPIHEKHYLEVLLLSPYIGKVTHTDSPRQEVCRYINDHYNLLVEPSDDTWWYGIWAPASAAH